MKLMEEMTPMGQIRLSKKLLLQMGIKPGDDVVFHMGEDGNIHILKQPAEGGGPYRQALASS